MDGIRKSSIDNELNGYEISRFQKDETLFNGNRSRAFQLFYLHWREPLIISVL